MKTKVIFGVSIRFFSKNLRSRAFTVTLKRRFYRKITIQMFYATIVLLKNHKDQLVISTLFTTCLNGVWSYFFLLISRHFTTIIHNSQTDWLCLQSSFFLDFHFRPWYSLNTVDLETFAKHTKLNYVPAKRSYPWSKKISNGFVLKQKCGVTKNVPKNPISKSFFQMLDIFISLWKKGLQHNMLCMEYIDWSVIAWYINSNLRFRSNTLRINMFPETQKP